MRLGQREQIPNVWVGVAIPVDIPDEGEEADTQRWNFRRGRGQSVQRWTLREAAATLVCHTIQSVLSRAVGPRLWVRSREEDITR